MKKKIFNQLKKLLLSILVMLLSLSSIGVSDVFSASSTQVNFIKQYAFIKSVKAFTTPNGFSRDKEGSDGHYIMSSTAGAVGSGKVLYCIEPGISLPGQTKGTYTTSASSMFTKKNSTTTAAAKKLLIAYVGGRSDFVNSWDGDMAWKTKTRVLVGNVLIWEITGEYRNASFNLVSSQSLKDIYSFTSYTDGNGVTHNASEIKAYFDEIYEKWELQIQNTIKELKMISYVNSKSYELVWNDDVERFEKSLTDKNKVTSLFTYKYSKEGVVYSNKSEDGNTITFRTYKNVDEIEKTDPVTVTFTGRTKKTTATVYGWVPSSGKQKFISIGDSSSADIQGYIKLYTNQKTSLGTFKILKTDEDGNIISGVDFEVTFPDDTSKVYTTDKDGLILIKDVPYGTYTIQEVNAPDIYVPDTKIETVTLDDENSDGQTITFHKVNKLKKGYIEVHKQDTSDGTGIKDVVLQLYSKKDDSLVETLITDEVGYAKSSLIPLGSYYIVEKGANSGIIIDPKAKDIELTDSQLDGDYYYTSVYLKNDVVKAKVRIYKECDVVKGFDVDTMTFEYEKARIGGMKFQIIASEDIKDLRNDEVIYSKGEIVYSGVCDNDGSKYVSLPVGDYIVKEVENPEGTILNSKEYSIHLSANDNVTQVIEETVVIVNERQCIDITVNKKDDQGLGLSGSVFGVYTKDDFLDASGNIVVEKNTMVGMIEPSPSGSISDLPYGQYYIKEIKAPKGFYLDDMQYDVCVEFDKNAQGYQKTLDIVNVAKKGNIQVYKYNPINQLNYPIEGVEFSVKASQDIINPTDGKVLFAKGYDFGTIVTNNQGIAVIEDLYPGEYVLVETHNPHLGYILDSTEHKVILKEDETVNLDIPNDSDSLVYRLKIKKSGDNGEALSGAKFMIKAAHDITDPSGKHVYYHKGDVVASDIVTDEKGIAVYYKEGNAKLDNDGALHPGVYEIIEVKAPQGYVLDSTPYTVVLDALEDAKESIIDFELTIKNHQGEVEFSKVETTSSKEITGAKLRLIDTVTDKIVEEWISENQSHIIKGLIEGRKYRLEEYLAPDGFVKSGDVEFVVDYSDERQKIVMKDELVNGKITIHKIGDVLTDYIDNQFIYEQSGLKGVTFDIYAKEDIISPVDHQTVLYSANTLIESIITDKDGYVVSSSLPLGKYEVKEVKTIDGFISNNQSYTVELKYQNQNTVLVNEYVEIVNERQKVDLKTIKADKGGKGLLGAHFTLTNKEAIKNIYGDIIVEANTVLDGQMSDANGYVSFRDDLPLGLYEVKETRAPLGYLLSDEVLVYDATYKGDQIPVVSLVQSMSNEISQLCISKVDVYHSQELAGAKMVLIDKMSGEVVDQWISSEESHLIEGLVVGKIYILKEEAAPNGYLVASEIEFVMSKELSGSTMIVEDERAFGQIKVYKEGYMLTDYQDGSFVYEMLPLADAEFEIIAYEDIVDIYSGDIIYHQGDIVETLVSGDDGYAYSKQLPLGKYQVRETKAPDGTVLNSELKDVELSYADDTTALVIEEVIFENDKYNVDLTLIKKDAETKQTIAGAKFAIYAKEDIYNVYDEIIVEAGTMIETAVSDDNGMIKFNADLPLGLYEIKEVQAPKGYVSSNDVIEIDARVSELPTLEMTIEIENKQTVVEVSKVDITNGKELPGCYLIVKDEYGKVVDSWISSDTSHMIRGLEVGKNYTLIEITAAKGYSRAESIDFTILDTAEIQTVVMKDEPIVETGDILNYNSYIVLAMISGCLLFVFLKKKEA